MKKILALMMALMMVFALAACGDGDQKETQDANTETSAVEETTPADSVVTITEAGQEGEGEVQIDTPLYTATVPAGLKYEVYTYYSGDDNLATVEINFGQEYATSGRLTVTTQRIVASLDDAVAECNRMNSGFEGYESTEAGEETHGAVTYKKLNTSTKYSKSDYLVSYYKNPAGYLYSDTYIELKVDPARIDLADPLVTALVDSIVLK